MMHLIAFEAAREHYEDLLREAEHERFIRTHLWSKESGGKGQFTKVIVTKLSGLIAQRRHVSHRLHTADA